MLGFQDLPSPQRLHPQREPSLEPQAQEGDQQSKRRHLREVQTERVGKIRSGRLAKHGVRNDYDDQADQRPADTSQ
jgi:hypothetical protein